MHDEQLSGFNSLTLTGGKIETNIQNEINKQTEGLLERSNGDKDSSESPKRQTSIRKKDIPLVAGRQKKSSKQVFDIAIEELDDESKELECSDSSVNSSDGSGISPGETGSKFANSSHKDSQLSHDTSFDKKRNGKTIVVTKHTTLNLVSTNKTKRSSLQIKADNINFGKQGLPSSKNKDNAWEFSRQNCKKADELLEKTDHNASQTSSLMSSDLDEVDELPN